jgi:hypothetical protein
VARQVHPDTWRAFVIPAARKEQTMLRTSFAAAVAVMAMSFATSADAYIAFNGTYSNIIVLNIVAFNGCQMQGVSMNGHPLASRPTVGALADAKDADPRAAAAETVRLAVEAVILPTGETVDLR